MKNIVTFDLETTGLDTDNCKIISIGLIKTTSKLQLMSRKYYVINPGIPIPDNVVELTGITNEQVSKALKFEHYAQEIISFIRDCDIAGFNNFAFDNKVLYREFTEASINWQYGDINFIDVGNLYKQLKPRTLSDAMVDYGVQLEDEGAAHNAMFDAMATLRILESMCNTEELLHQKSIEDISLLSNYGKRLLDISNKFYENEQGDICLSFGKYRGEPAKNHLDFVRWMTTKDFPQDTLQICNNLLGWN